MNKQELLKNLTGVGSSKLSYYTDLKDKTKELEERNTQLEIINEIAKSIKLDANLKNTLGKIAFLLDKVIPISMLAIYPQNGKVGACVVKSYHDDEFVNVEKIDGLDEVNLNSHVRPKSFLFNGETVFTLKAKTDYLGFLIIKVEKNTEIDARKGEFLINLTDHLSIGLENSQLYREVLALNRRWEETFKAITDQIYVIDKYYNLLRFNEAAKRFYDLEEIAFEKKCYKAFHNIKKPCQKCPVKKMFKEKSPVQIRKKIGDDYFDVYAYPFKDKEGEVQGGVLSERNITEKLMMESQLIQSAKLKSTGEMAAGVAHELNNPLTTVLGNSQLLLSELQEDEDKKLLAKRIYESGKRCKNIIKKLLTYAREEENTLEKVCLNDCVDDALDMLTYQFEKQGIEMIYDKEEELPAVLGNKQQLEQVIINLLLNSRDAVENVKEPKIKICTSSVFEEETEWVYVSVEDNGCGISDKEKESLCQPFFTTKEEGKGYGLGLFVSMGISRNHNGEIKVQSQEGKGSTFTVYIPSSN